MTAVVAAIQMNTTDHIPDNLDLAAQLIKEAAKSGARCAVLPEMFAFIGKQPALLLQPSIPLHMETVQTTLSTLAKQQKIWIVGGTIPMACKDPQRVRAACLMYDDQGALVARYDKIHLFDAIVKNKEVYRESDQYQAGNTPVAINTPVGKVGFTVCYDIRFPELFRILFNQGVTTFMVPAAFTQPTGQAHWEVLLRARAIENLSYVVAAAQWGQHANGRQTYGHSMIVDPWGKILASQAEGNGVVLADIDLNHLQSLRSQMPVADHQRFKCVG